MRVRLIILVGVALMLGAYLLLPSSEGPVPISTLAAEQEPDGDLETRLAPLAKKLAEPKQGEWLFHHFEGGQTFAQYTKAKPVRKSKELSTIYLCLIGDFTQDQERIMDLTREYMETFFQAPVKVHARVALKTIPEKAKRVHPDWGERQILSTYVLDDLLRPDRPDDALAYLAFTASDLWPGKGWNFVFGQASLQHRTGVWSIYRNGDPAKSQASFQRCLMRTFGTATHETGHILTMLHCTAYQCSMNGTNNLEEADSRPLHLCPVCLHKLCWNLQIEPVPYLGKLEEFCKRQHLKDEADWYRQAIAALNRNKKE